MSFSRVFTKRVDIFILRFDKDKLSNHRRKVPFQLEIFDIIRIYFGQSQSVEKIHKNYRHMISCSFILEEDY